MSHEQEVRLLLIIVAFHPGEEEVEALATCLAQLSPWISYVVVANDHREGEPVDRLVEGAGLFLSCERNLGYGRAVNRAVREVERRSCLPEWIGALNTDLSWTPGSFEALLAWLEGQADVSLAVPRITDPAGQSQLLCKQDPTLLGLLSRRFLPEFLKPAGLRLYDRRYVMADQDLHAVFEVPYLSGCCMLIRTSSFLAVGGFDERYFLYLEDADLTRRLREHGRTVHLPVASVVHAWGRGNYRSLRLTLVNLHSASIYFRTWGFRWR
ncbi:glycosyltransferase family 2 protein [Synechococcus sp. 1G10]|uniref:glycosyltransferase family 2 protein n=1 Tax=Synechococcus sp. 1G10 TaxID=2025605 RepID=UPI001E38F92B|nr:glycosyltransferase family 2 protein [Synechococcus sp. 1G10]